MLSVLLTIKMVPDFVASYYFGHHPTNVFSETWLMMIYQLKCMRSIMTILFLTFSLTFTF